MIVVFAAGIGVWPASYAVASEASALRLRSKTQGIGWISYGLGRPPRTKNRGETPVQLTVTFRHDGIRRRDALLIRT